MRARAERFAQALLAVEADLDWRALEAVYCDAESDGFFAPEQIEAIRETGLLLADDLAACLATLPPEAPPLSLYVGAGVAELAPMLCETVVLARQVQVVSLPGVELEALARTFAGVGERLGLPMPRVTGLPLAELPREPASHGWLVSVLTDPERFPALHDELYGRSGELATGRGVLGEERARARGLVLDLLARLEAPAVLSTTDEELALVGPLCRESGCALEVPPRARLSGVVGDPVRVCRLLRRPGGSAAARP